jgi:tRNA-(ms[2]io[6]A)-hydroxylase
VSAQDEELQKFYQALYSSELGHFKVFLRLAYKISKRDVVDTRWQQMLASEAAILARQEPGPRIHSGL